MELEIFIELARQMPIAAFVAWFIIKQNRDATAQIKLINDAWITASQNQADSCRALITERHDVGLETLEKMTETLDSLTRQVAKNTAITILHDATVRGENPETIGTTEDVMGKLLRKTDRYSPNKN